MFFIDREGNAPVDGFVDVVVVYSSFLLYLGGILRRKNTLFDIFQVQYISTY